MFSLITEKSSAQITCSASTTASNSHTRDRTDFDEVMCDWLSFRHDFPAEQQNPVLEAGKILKIDRDGVIEHEIQQWEQIRCPSSDTSIRIKCDGRHIWFQGNIGRFQEPDNFKGLTVSQCFDKAASLIRRYIPGNLTALGTVQRIGTVAEYGTYITRIDLAHNIYTDQYLLLSQQLSARRIGQRIARVGKYGPTWGYDAKRGQYWKAKLYDKTAELEGKRTPNPNSTTARFEVQLGSEYLRQHNLNHLINWTEETDMENIIYAQFAKQAFAHNATKDELLDIPTKLRQHAIMWREGVDPKAYLSRAQYYKVRSALIEYGVDISIPCDVVHFHTPVRVIEVYPVSTRRAA